MKKDEKGKDCVEREAVIKAIRTTRRFPSGQGDADFVCIEELLKAITQIPSFPARRALPASDKRRPDAEIEKAIENLEENSIGAVAATKDINLGDSYQADADLLRWVLNQKQDTWTDGELLGEPPALSARERRENRDEKEKD